jgi:hypothetical protein
MYTAITHLSIIYNHMTSTHLHIYPYETNTMYIIIKEKNMKKLTKNHMLQYCYCQDSKCDVEMQKKR